MGTCVQYLRSDRKAGKILNSEKPSSIRPCLSGGRHDRYFFEAKAVPGHAGRAKSGQPVNRRCVRRCSAGSRRHWLEAPQVDSPCRGKNVRFGRKATHSMQSRFCFSQIAGGRVFRRMFLASMPVARFNPGTPRKFLDKETWSQCGARQANQSPSSRFRLACDSNLGAPLKGWSFRVRQSLEASVDRPRTCKRCQMMSWSSSDQEENRALAFLCDVGSVPLAEINPLIDAR